MAPRQPFLWVNMDSRGKSEGSARQTSNIKSHCAQYYYQADRKKLWAASDDLEVPDSTSIPSPKRPSSWHGNCTEQDQTATFFDRSPKSSPKPHKFKVYVEQTSQQTKRRQPSMKKRKLQEWRKVRCSRFRKQTLSDAVESDFLSISPEVLKKLPAVMDSYGFDMLKYFYVDLLPQMFPEQQSATSMKNFYFDSMLSDPLQLSVCMTWLFSRAVYPSPPCSDAISSLECDDISPIRRTLCLYKLSTIALIRQRLSEPTSIRDQNIFLGIVTLANCSFMANNPAEGRLHLEACLEIGRARGGGLTALSELELDQMCTAEFGIAALSGGVPCTPVCEMEAAVDSKFSMPRDDARFAKSGLAKLGCLNLEHALPIQEGLANLFDTTTRINESTLSKSGLSDGLVLRGTFAGFQLCSAQQPVPQHHETTSAELDLCEPLRLASILVVSMTSMRKTPNEHVFDRLTESIALRLQQTHVQSRSSRSTIVSLLWICFIGAHGSLALSSKQAFFLQHINQLARMLLLRNWSAVREELKQFPYIDNDFDSPFEGVFKSACMSSPSMSP